MNKLLRCIIGCNALLLALGLSQVAPAAEQVTPEQLAKAPADAADAIGQDALAEMKSRYARPDAIPFPEDNPFSRAKVELGEMLFFDPRLSGSNLLSCASCHNPSFGWEDGQATATGHGMGVLGRHTPTILNLAWGESFFWDGRADSLEEQALGPIQAPGEMHQELGSLLAELSEIEGYRQRFEAAFPGEGITEDTLAMAIATYERTVVSNLAPFDLWIRGDESAISAEAQHGFVLFNTKGNCAACHSGWNMTDDSYQDIGLPSNDAGREAVIGLPELRHAFKTPGLRNIVERRPYMHDGSLSTLREVVDHYADGFVQRPTLSDDIVPLELDDAEREAIVAFMRTLSSQDDPVVAPILPN